MENHARQQLPRINKKLLGYFKDSLACGTPLAGFWQGKKPVEQNALCVKPERKPRNGNS
jgi:hypothetical protein